MSASAVQALLISGLGDFGTAMLVVLTFVIATAVGFFVFRLGWNSVKDSSK